MRRFGVFLVLLSAPFATHADDLYQVYQLAVHYDPTLHAAHAAMKANKQALPEALAQMLPNLSANYSTTGNSASTNFPSIYVYNGSYNTQSYGLTLTQPIYHPEHWAQLEQARHVAKGAGANYLSSAQTLIVRVADRYFAILAAIDDLDFFAGQRKAFTREYDQAKQRFDVGLIAITDVETAKARFDNAIANEISAQNAVEDQYELLREIIGRPLPNGIHLFSVSQALPLKPPVPNEQEAWVHTANLQNLKVIAAKENAEQYKAAIGAQVAGHFPKVDVSAGLQRNKAAPPFNDIVYDRTVSLNVSMPLFSGGGVVFRTKEAKARYTEAMEQLEQQQREADSATRQAFRGVLSSISSVNALAQAVASNASSVKATQAAYEVGTRTIVDVLNAQTALLNAQREHAKARYNYLLEGLKLKQAAGTLTAEDMFWVNEIITGKATA